MAEIRKRVRNMPRIAKLLTALLSCALVVTLIAVATAETITITPDEAKTIEISSTALELSRPTPKGEYDTSYPEYKKNSSGKALEEWTYENSNGLQGWVKCETESRSSYTANTTVLKITNKSDKKISLSFNYKVTEENTTHVLVIGGTTCETAEGEYTSGAIAKDASIEIWLTANAAEKGGLKSAPEVDLSITELQAAEVSGTQLTLLTPENGSYTAASSNQEIGVTMAAGATASSISFNPAENETVTLTATSSDGYAFYMWVDESGTPLSQNNPVTVDGSTVNTASICPVFVSNTTEKTPSYQIPGSGKLSGNYYYWDDAMNAALNGPEKNVVLLTDVTLSSTMNRQENTNSTTFTIPNGVTLVVPYSDARSTSATDVVNTSDASNPFGVTSSAVGTAYRTLTVPENCNLNVNGTLLVNALQGADNGVSYQSHIVGDYGQMVVAGTVQVNNGGKLYARGYVTDINHTSGTHNGQINVEDGGSLIQMMQITDYRGGTYTSAVYQQLMPITMYYLQNNMVDTTYKYGATMRAQAVLAGWLGGYKAVLADVRVIANDANKDTPCMFVMDNYASISTKYNYAEDKLHVTLNQGKVTMNFLQIDHSMMTIDTSKNVLAISDNMPIEVAAGATLETNYDLKFLPGAELTVNGTLQINKGSDLYFYGKEDYQEIWSYNQFRTHIQSVGIVKESKTTPNTDAALNLNGTLILSGTLSQSTNHGGLLAKPGGSAKVTINQLQYDGKRVNESLTLSYTPPETPASGITYVAAGDNYYAINKGWIAPLGNLSENPTQLASIKNTGTYQRSENNNFWYQFALTVKYDGITQADKTVYVSKSSTVLEAPDDTVITAISGVEEKDYRTVQSTNYNNALTDGWKQVQLLNLTGDTTITLTCKNYAKTVTWNEFYSETAAKANNTVVSYLADTENTASHTFEGTVTKVTVAGEVLAEGTGYTLSNNGKTVTLNNVNTGMTISVYAKDVTSSVTWNVIDPTGKSVEVNSSEHTYTITQPDDAWWVAEMGNCSVSDANVTVTISQDKRTLSLGNVTGPVTVTVNLTEYQHCINGTINYEKTAIVAGRWATSEYNLEHATSSIVSKYTNDDEYRWTIPGDGEKNLLTKITVISGCSIGGTNEVNDELRQELGDTLAVQLTDKDVKLEVKTRNYIAKMTWKVSKSDDASYDGGYVEYYTGQKMSYDYENEKTYYESLLSDGTVSTYYREDYYYEKFFSTYTVPQSAGNYTVEYANEGTDTIPLDDGSNNLQKQWGFTNPEMSRTFECYTYSYKTTNFLYDVANDSTATLVLKPYAYTVKFVDASKLGTPLAEYCVAEGTDSVQYKPEWPDSWNGRCVVGFEIQDGDEAKVNDLKIAEVGTVIIEEKMGCTLTGITKDTTVKLTLENTSKVFSNKINWTIRDKKNNKVYNYTEYLLADEGDVFINPFEETDVTADRHTWEGNNVTYTLPDGYDNCYINEVSGSKTDRRSLTKKVTYSSYSSTSQTITIQPYAKRVVAYINNVPSNYYYYDTMDAKPSGVFVFCGDDITVSRYIADGCEVTNLNASNPNSYSVRLDNVDAMDARLYIWTEPKGTDVTTSAAYYMGDLSFEYVRNAAAYVWNGLADTSGAWKPMDSFTWRHTAGSKTYEVGDKSYTVANGSILFVNDLKNTPVTYTVQLSGSGNYGVSLGFGEQDGVTVKDGVATVTVQPNNQLTLVCVLTGTPTLPEGKTTADIGTITVTKN